MKAVKQEIQDMIADYIHFLRVERQLSTNTLQSYERDIRDYTQNIFDIQQLETFDDVERYHIL